MVSLEKLFSDIADAIRRAKETTNTIVANDFPEEIDSIVTVYNQDKVVTPSIARQTITADEGYTGLGTVQVEPVTGVIDEDINPDNIMVGYNILGVEGTATSDADALAEDILETKTAYVNGEKILGTIPNNGFLYYGMSEQQQEIPAGYTTGGFIEPAVFTEMSDYAVCLAKTQQILEGVE